MHLKDPDVLTNSVCPDLKDPGMANNIGPDQTAPRGPGYDKQYRL